MRNENLVASHLLKSVQWWTDSGLGEFELHYVRDKQQREVDFLVVSNGEPYLLVECKTSLDEPLSPALQYFNEKLKPKYAVQVAVEADAAGVNPLEYAGCPVKMSAADFLSVLI